MSVNRWHRYADCDGQVTRADVFLIACFGTAIGTLLAILGTVAIAVVDAGGTDIGSVLAGLILLPLIYAMALLIAVLTVLPLGFTLGWLINLVLPLTRVRSASVGFLTGGIYGWWGLVWLTKWDNEPVEPGTWVAITAIAAAGAISGWLAHRTALAQPEYDQMQATG